MVSSRVTKLCDRVACSAKGARSTGLSLSSGSLLHTSVRSHNRPKRSRHAPRLRSGTNSRRKLRNWVCLAFCKCAGAPAPPFWHLATMVQPKIRPCISQRTLAGPHFFVFFLSRLPLLCPRFNFTSHSTVCFSYPIALRSCCESSFHNRQHPPGWSAHRSSSADTVWIEGCKGCKSWHSYPLSWGALRSAAPLCSQHLGTHGCVPAPLRPPNTLVQLCSRVSAVSSRALRHAAAPHGRLNGGRPQRRRHVVERRSRRHGCAHTFAGPAGMAHCGVHLHRISYPAVYLLVALYVAPLQEGWAGKLGLLTIRVRCAGRGAAGERDTAAQS